MSGKSCTVVVTRKMGEAIRVNGPCEIRVLRSTAGGNRVCLRITSVPFEVDKSEEIDALTKRNAEQAAVESLAEWN